MGIVLVYIIKYRINCAIIIIIIEPILRREQSLSYVYVVRDMNIHLIHTFSVFVVHDV